MTVKKKQSRPGRPRMAAKDKKVQVIFYVPQKKANEVRTQCAQLIKTICEPLQS